MFLIAPVAGHCWSLTTFNRNIVALRKIKTSYNVAFTNWFSLITAKTLKTSSACISGCAIIKCSRPRPRFIITVTLMKMQFFCKNCNFYSYLNQRSCKRSPNIWSWYMSVCFIHVHNTRTGDDRRYGRKL